MMTKPQITKNYVDPSISPALPTEADGVEHDQRNDDGM